MFRLPAQTATSLPDASTSQRYPHRVLAVPLARSPYSFIIAIIHRHAPGLTEIFRLAPF